jgi:hypothetical protein
MMIHPLKTGVLILSSCHLLRLHNACGAHAKLRTLYLLALYFLYYLLFRGRNISTAEAFYSKYTNTFSFLQYLLGGKSSSSHS